MEGVKNLQFAVTQPLPTFHSLPPRELSVGQKFSSSCFFVFSFFEKVRILPFSPLTSQGSTTKRYPFENVLPSLPEPLVSVAQILKTRGVCCTIWRGAGIGVWGFDKLASP